MSGGIVGRDFKTFRRTTTSSVGRSGKDRLRYICKEAFFKPPRAKTEHIYSTSNKIRSLALQFEDIAKMDWVTGRAASSDITLLSQDSFKWVPWQWFVRQFYSVWRSLQTQNDKNWQSGFSCLAAQFRQDRYPHSSPTMNGFWKWVSFKFRQELVEFFCHITIGGVCVIRWVIQNSMKAVSACQHVHALSREWIGCARRHFRVNQWRMSARSI